MPRSLAIGNGNSLITVDKYARLRDFYFPYVGLENHIGGGYMHRVGVWIDQQFSWLDDGSWDINIDANDKNQGVIVALSRKFAIRIEMLDILHHTKNCYIRRYIIKTERDEVKQVKLFINQQFEIAQTEKGDTAYFEPESHSIVHYEGRRAFVIGMKQGARFFDDYSVGIFHIEGKEGTYRDAEDGVLAKNNIEHGRVDSVVAISVTATRDGGKEPVYYWIAVGSFIDETKNLHLELLRGDPQLLIDENAHFWSSWVNRLNMRFYGLGERVIALFNQSQLYIRSHVDQRGAIIASGDAEMLTNGRDTYSYMWPRDGAYVATALDWIGDRHHARTFFEFCNSVISKEGYLMHKYRPDRSLGSSWHGWMVNNHAELPIQEDETALVIWALWEHWEASKDLDFIGTIYQTLIKPAAIFMLNYRDAKSGLPKPSYNLWEERFAIHTYTAASVFAALGAAARFTEMMGDTELATELFQAQEEVRSAIIEHCLVDGNFIRSIIINEEQKMEKDLTCDASSVYGIFIFGVLPPDDQRVINAVESTKKILTVNTPVAGIARYDGDKYYRSHENVQGNPWIITTLWYTQYDIMRARDDHDLDKVRKVLSWVEQNASRSGVLPEQLDPYTREHLSAAPLTWSHAEYIRTVIMYLRKIKELNIVN